VGVGSPHGADSIGWSVLEHLQKRNQIAATFRNVLKPIDMLDLLGDWDELIVIDAVEGTAVDLTECWTWPCVQLNAALSCGTHGFGLVQALQLAQELRLLPKYVTIVGVSMESWSTVANSLPKLEELLAKTAERIEVIYA